jgi:protein-disulfide isomerase
MKQREPTTHAGKKLIRLRRTGLLLAVLLAVPVAGAAFAQTADQHPDAAALQALAEGAPIIGNPQGRDTIVEFFDYRCSYCRAEQRAFLRLLAQDKQARIVLEEWPIFGGVSIYAARVALASAWQGRFPAVHEALFASRGPLDRERIRQIAELAGVNLARLDYDMTADRAQLDRALSRVAARAKTLRLSGTPGLVIGGTVVSGALSFHDLEDLLARARRKHVHAPPLMTQITDLHARQ